MKLSAEVESGENTSGRVNQKPLFLIKGSYELPHGISKLINEKVRTLILCHLLPIACNSPNFFCTYLYYAKAHFLLY